MFVCASVRSFVLFFLLRGFLFIVHRLFVHLLVLVGVVVVQLLQQQLIKLQLFSNSFLRIFYAVVFDHHSIVTSLVTLILSYDF